MVEAQPRSAAVQPSGRPSPDAAGDVPIMEDLTPAQIVAELDRFIIGQGDAKRAVAVALRNRFRRQLLPEEMRGEVVPKNILMMGPTGVGKTEIARRVAKIVDAPFVKVEATRFTEVGYVGRDVESIVRDLCEVAIDMLHSRRLEQVKEEADQAARQRLVDLLTEQLLADAGSRNGRGAAMPGAPGAKRVTAAEERRRKREQDRLLALLNEEALEEETVEIEVDPQFADSPFEAVGGLTPDELYDSFQDFLDGYAPPPRRSRRRVSVREARRILEQQEEDRLVDWDFVIENAVRRVEQAGVVFIDEIDKTISSNEEFSGVVSGEGVQRDLLPIVEGSVVMTRYGPVRTDHILFVAAGSFHDTKPSDLIPELQGRFPMGGGLGSRGEEDLYAMLPEPQNALTKQYRALLA